MKTHAVTTIKFKMGNTIFVQDFVICEDLVRPIIIGRDFTVNNFIGIIWTKQGMKKVTQDNRVIIVEEPARGKTLSMMRRIVIPTRQYAEFELECDEMEGKFEIKPEPFLQQRETKKWEMPIRNKDMQIVSNETREETKRYVYHNAFLILTV